MKIQRYFILYLGLLVGLSFSWGLSSQAQNLERPQTTSRFVQRQITSSAGAIPLAPDRYEFAFGVTGTGAGRFNLPVGVAVDDSQYIWVADRANGTIQKFDSDGSYIFSATPPVSLTNIENLAVSSTNDIYVVDSGTDAVYGFFGIGGSVFATSSLSLNNPIDVVQTGAFVYVLDATSIYRLNSGLTSPTTLVSSGLGIPQGIAADSSNNLYVTDTSTDSVLKYDSSGTFLTSFPLTYSDPRGIAIDQNTGTIYVADTVANTIEMLNSSGTSIGLIASTGSSLGQVNAPFDVTVSLDGKRLIVADSGNDRVEIFCDGVCNVPFSDTDSNVNPDMKLNVYGFPVVSYYNGTDSSLHLAFCGDARCDTLEDYEVDNTADVGLQSSLGFNSSYQPIIAYYDKTNGALKLAKCENRNSCASPSIITVDDSGANNTGWNPALALTSNTAYIAYYNFSTKTLSLINCDVSTMTLTCGTATNLDTPTSYPHPDLVLNDAGFASLVYEAWTSGTASTLRLIRCGNAACTSGVTNTTVDSTATQVFYPALTLNSSNQPVIAYMAGAPTAGLYLATCSDTTCSASPTINQVAAGGTGFFADVKINSSGNPVISYHNTADYNLNLAECANAACSSASVLSIDNRYNTGRVTSLQLDANDDPIISYFNNPEFDLRLYLPRDTAQCFVRNSTTGRASRSLTHGAVQWLHDHSTTVASDTLQIAGTCTGTKDWDVNSSRETVNLTKSINLTGGYNPNSGQGDPDWSASLPSNYQTILQAATTNSTSNQGRVLYVEGSTGTNSTVTGLTLRNGNSTGLGGGIHVESGATLTLDNSKVQSNRTSSTTGGGGIYSAGSLTIQNGSLIGGLKNSTGNQVTGAGGDGGGIYLNSSSPSLIDDSTVSGNSTPNASAALGGGIYRSGIGLLTIQNGSVIGGVFGTNDSGNSAGSGGGIYNAAGSLMLDASTVSGNEASASSGGGIFNSGTLTIQNGSTIGGSQTDTGNRVTASDGDGGGIFVISTAASTSIQASTITGNRTTNGTGANGAGLAIGGVASTNTLTMENVTISGNQASGSGGAIYQALINTSLKYVTIVNNLADNDTSDGLYRFSGTLNVQNSIVAFNGDANNNIGNDNCSGTILNSGGNYTNTGSDCTSFSADASLNLGALTNNGGTAETHALLNGAAIDGGGAGSNCPTVDERGIARSAIVSNCDAGAYESNTPTCFVDANNDNVTDFESDDQSAVQLAVNAAISGATLKVAGTCTGVSSGNGSGSSETLYIDKNITIEGGYNANGVNPIWTTSDPSLYTTILQAASDNSTSDQGRVVYIEGSTSSIVTLTGLTLRNGNSSGAGAGIHLESGASLTLDKSIVQSNISSSATGGGGIYSAGTLTIQNGSLIGGSSADGTGNFVTANGADGAGIYINSSADTLIDASSISGNICSGTGAADGGGIYKTNSGNLTIQANSLIGGEQGTTGNQGFNGGGIYYNAGALRINSSTVSGNNAVGVNGGGGIYHVGTGNLTIENNSVIGGRQSNPSTGNVSTGSAADGAGLYLSSSSPTLIDASIVSGNKTTITTGASGGGIYNNGTGNLTIQNNSVIGGEQGTTGNQAGRGGGISNSNNTLTINDSTVSGNVATDSIGGGGILTTTVLNLENGSLVGGTRGSTGNAVTASGADGGGIYLFSGSAIIDGSTVSGNTVSNTSSSEGGGIYKNSSGNLTIRNGSTIGGDLANLGNYAYDAGAIRNDGTGALLISDTVISRNESDGLSSTAAIYSSASLTIERTTIADNLSSNSSGGTGGDLRLIRRRPIRLRIAPLVVIRVRV